MVFGLGGMNPEKMEKMMKKMGIKTTQIDAEQVIINCKDKKIIIDNPNIMVTNVMGQDAYQITGSVREEKAVREEDIKMVMEKTGKPREEVLAKLEELDNDLVRAIMELKEKE